MLKDSTVREQFREQWSVHLVWTTGRLATGL